MNPETKAILEQMDLIASNFKTLSVIFKRFLDDDPFPCPDSEKDKTHLLNSMYFLTGFGDLIEYYYKESSTLVHSYYHPADNQ